MDQLDNRFFRERDSAASTGGPAFPIPGLQSDADFNGMSLRDYFIAHIGDENQGPEGCDYSDAVKALLVGRQCPDGRADGWLAVLQFEADFRAAWRVMRADAMLRAREAV